MKDLFSLLMMLWRICVVYSVAIPRNRTSYNTELKTNSTLTSKRNATSPASFAEEINEFKLKYEEYVQPGRNVSKLLEAVFAQYDKRIRPFYEVKPLSVGLDILILSFGELREASMEYSVDMYLGQFWQDPRLAFDLDRIIILGGEASEKLWVPDTFFVNSIESKIQKMLFTNKKVWINLKNGTMMLSARLVSRNSCKFDLRNYPLDEQTCHLAFESFSYSELDLTYSWRNKSTGSDIGVYDREMAQFDIVSAKRYLKNEIYHSDMFSGLTATIIFKRRAAYYIFQMYIPSVCITGLSWISFWINHEAVPARVGLSITTVLTISYMRGSVNADMPRVSYLKSIDYFLLVSFGFIFMTLIEYVFVLKYSRKQTKSKSTKYSLPTECATDDEVEKMPMIVTVSVGNKSFNFESSLDELERNGNGIPLQEPQTIDSCKPFFYRGKKLNGNSTTKKDKENKLTRVIRKSLLPPDGIHWLDQYARVIFPLSYTVFLIAYFIYYSNAYDKVVAAK